MISFGARLLLCGIKVVYSALQQRIGTKKPPRQYYKGHKDIAKKASRRF
jgi:hypothetical protein